ncbi:MAG: bactofilin family protein [Hyphomicrobiales bacterium]
MFFRKKTGSAKSAVGRGSRVGPSIIGSDVVIQGNLVTAGDLQIDGTIQGDVRATAVVVGPQGAIHGELAAEEVVVRGRVIGPIRGTRVRVFSGAHVDGDIVHDSLAVETGAFCQGSIRRSEDPLAQHGGRLQQPQAVVHHDHEPDLEEDEEPRRPQRRPIMLRSRAAE